MMRCAIQWVDDNGRPTADANPAVVLAVHTIIEIIEPSGEKNIRRFPCCADHAVQLDELVRRCPMVSEDRGRTLYTSQWTKESL